MSNSISSSGIRDANLSGLFVEKTDFPHQKSAKCWCGSGGETTSLLQTRRVLRASSEVDSNIAITGRELCHEISIGCKLEDGVEAWRDQTSILCRHLSIQAGLVARFKSSKIEIAAGTLEA